MRSRGFSLIELMVTIAIVAILAAIAFPSFQSTLRSNRLATTTNEMLASVALARSEAIRSTRGGGICASADGATCGTATWNDGWLVWSDNGDDSSTFGSFQSGVDSVVRVVDAHPRMQLNGTVPGGFAIRTIGFDRRGRPVAAVGTPVSLEVKPADCPAGQELVRTLELNAVGQMVNRKGTCT